MSESEQKSSSARTHESLPDRHRHLPQLETGVGRLCVAVALHGAGVLVIRVIQLAVRQLK